MHQFATHYLGPVAADIKEYKSDLLFWASPYNVGNRTRFERSRILTPEMMGSLWQQVFQVGAISATAASFWTIEHSLGSCFMSCILQVWAPSFDLVAPQDSMGAQGNSFQNASDYLGNISVGAARAGRETWSNVELFEVWPRSCQWPTRCEGRHPAPFSRIEQQMANEWKFTSPLIAWEWMSCLSPNSARAGRVLPPTCVFN